MPRKYKLARKMKKIALKEAAQVLGVSQPALSAWESERKNPSLDSLINMSKYYGVTVDFLLGIESEGDPRLHMELMTPVSPAALPALHGTPVYSKNDGWAFVDAVERQLCFADGHTLPFADIRDINFIPPAFSVGLTATEDPLKRDELSSHKQVWVEPISTDYKLQLELRGWYRVKDCFVENEVGQRFYFDFYGAKWLAFSEIVDG